ncbi:MAG TPA: CHAT domain-containing protein [Thermoanaerobaculia bacterium]|nr:CHAT domain-containing protein [Thermoanaerobaculia bacterium]
MGLRELAATAWQQYLEIDGASAWSDEARSELRTLRDRRAPVESDDAEAIETRVLEDLLPAWAEAHLDGGRGEARPRSEAAAAAATYQRRYGDQLLSSLVAATAGVARDDRRMQLARAHLLFQRARGEYRRRDLPRCRQDALAARDLLAGLDSPLAPWAALTTASCAYLETDLAASETGVSEAGDLARHLAVNSTLLEGQLEWMSALLAHSRGQPVLSLQRYDRALAAFRRARDLPREARLHSLLADLDEYLGRADGAWNEAAQAAAGPLDPRRRYQALSTLTRLASDDGFVRLALRIAAAAAAEAAQAQDADFAADAKIGLAQAQARAGHRQAAITTLRAALREARAITPPVVAAHRAAYAQVALAEILAALDPKAAEALLATSDLRATGELQVTAAQLRAAILRRGGSSAEAEAVLRGAIAASGGERRQFATLSDRDQFFSRRESLYHQLIELLVDRGGAADALDALELWRREALSGGTQKTSPGRSPQRTQRWHGDARESETTFYALLALPRELLVWSVARNGVVLRRYPMTRAEVAKLVAETSRGTRAGQPPTASARVAKLIFGEGIEPQVKRIVIAPDSTFFAMPFAALPSPSGAGPLVARYEIALTPSIGLWAGPTASAELGNGCALIVEGSATGGDSFPELPSLPRLEEEVRAISTRYRCVEVARTPAELRAGVAKSPSLVHYAGHSLASGPSGAAILLADGGQVVPLESTEIETWKLRGAIVVLSSCSGGNGRASPIAGRDSLARAFLAAGARAVVANLWPVDDNAAAALAVELHDRLGHGQAVGTALRDSQQALISARRPPADWAGWMLIGTG